MEHRLPMLTFKTEDEILQIKQFVLVYYQPILSKLDMMMLGKTFSKVAPVREITLKKQSRNLSNEGLVKMSKF